MRAQNLRVALALLLLPADIWALQSATLDIDFTAVLGPQVTACPVSNSASIAALNLCEDDQFTSVFNKCLVGTCGKVSCSWYKSIAKTCLPSFCTVNSNTWSDWASAECSGNGANHATTTKSPGSVTSVKSFASIASVTASASSTSSVAVSTPSATASVAPVGTTPRATATASPTSALTSGTQAAVSSSTSTGEAAGSSGYLYDRAFTTFFGVLVAILYGM